MLLKLSEKMNVYNLEGLFELANKLFAQESIPSKNSACLLMPICYKILLNTNEDKKSSSSDENIYIMFNEILQDDTAFNRKNIAENIKLIFEMIKNSNLSIELKKNKGEKYIEMVNKLFGSDSDTVRNSCQECFLEACETKIVTSSEVHKRILKGLKDQSWRVRYEICDKIHQIMNNLDSTTNESLACEYVVLLTDPENEVQSACIENLSKILKQCPAGTKKTV